MFGGQIKTVVSNAYLHITMLGPPDDICQSSGKAIIHPPSEKRLKNYVSPSPICVRLHDDLSVRGYMAVMKLLVEITIDAVSRFFIDVKIFVYES